KVAAILFIVVFFRAALVQKLKPIRLLEIKKQVQPEIVGLAHTLVFSSGHIAGNFIESQIYGRLIAVADKGQSRRKATVFKVGTQAGPVPQQAGTRQNQLKGAQ